MRLVGISAVAVAIIIFVSLSSGAEPEAVAPTISASQGATLPERPSFNFIQRAPPEAVVERTDEPERIVRAQSLVRAVRQSEPPVPAPAPPVPVPAPLPSAPQVAPNVLACLKHFTGDTCMFTESGETKTGTCMTLAWSPVTCVPH